MIDRTVLILAVQCWHSKLEIADPVFPAKR